ncbi:hypothetical protein I5M27_05995 [Adhaeribacter sp. BT258]|uniref:Intradiol ring-cleavage dioxygenases domain-containing protein n=1 Tax=Adhaeribacter terrigena TaxID=2793070 RepID=A0ABS1C1M5_9BACT|nr:hypothetical protein [Adhaeribacter terrigena]MBK0402528.1 hypothetical protein [Adhaeribacter terrigena]
MDRKKFLLSYSLLALSFSTFGSVVKKLDGNYVGDCETTNDILGPFYRPNAPLRTDLTFEGLTGNQLMIKGKVLGADCRTPLQGALVEIWHCDTQGEYDNDSKAFRHRAGWKTNNQGEYAFKTIIPGKYLNGDLYRPSHIHFRVTHKSGRELISQIYFNGDPHIPADPWASQGKAKHRILNIYPDDVNSTLAINFDISLRNK